MGNPDTREPYDILQERGNLSVLELSLRNEWARAAQQARGAPFALLVGPCAGEDGLGVGEGMVSQTTCRWDVVCDVGDCTVVQLVISSPTDVKVVDSSAAGGDGPSSRRGGSTGRSAPIDDKSERTNPHSRRLSNGGTMSDLLPADSADRFDRHHSVVEGSFEKKTSSGPTKKPSKDSIVDSPPPTAHRSRSSLRDSAAEAWWSGDTAANNQRLSAQSSATTRTSSSSYHDENLNRSVGASNGPTGAPVPAPRDAPRGSRNATTTNANGGSSSAGAPDHVDPDSSEDGEEGPPRLRELPQELVEEHEQLLKELEERVELAVSMNSAIPDAEQVGVLIGVLS